MPELSVRVLYIMSRNHGAVLQPFTACVLNTFHCACTACMLRGAGAQYVDHWDDAPDLLNAMNLDPNDAANEGQYEGGERKGGAGNFLATDHGVV